MDKSEDLRRKSEKYWTDETEKNRGCYNWPQNTHTFKRAIPTGN